MKFLVCLVALAACAEALPRNRTRSDIKELLRELELKLEAKRSPIFPDCGNYRKQEVPLGQPITLDHVSENGDPCSWSYEAPRDLHLEVDVIEAHFHHDDACQSGSLTLTGQSSGTSKVCGFCNQGTYYTGSNILRVRFESDGTYVGMGDTTFGSFTLKISAVMIRNYAQGGNYGPTTSCVVENTSGQPHSSHCDPHHGPPVHLGAGELEENAIMSPILGGGMYGDNMCLAWRITTVRHVCIRVKVGQWGFDTEPKHDYVIFKDSQLSEHHLWGKYSPGEVLFTSKTNVVDVKFVTDSNVVERGFSLDLESVECDGGKVLPVTESDDCAEAQELRLSPGETLKDALVIQSDDERHYPNNACQAWTIYADAEQDQCIAVTAGDGGFETQAGHDYISFWDHRYLNEETRKEGKYIPGRFLFNSLSNIAYIRFISDGTVKMPGFTLDVHSFNCYYRLA